MENNKSVENAIPVFFAADDYYTPFVGICLKSLIENTTEANHYLIKILHTDIKAGNKKRILKLQKENVDIEFVDLNYYIDKIKDKLYTRDYYSKTTYFRLFIPNLYPQYNKAIYIDSDTIVLDDIANLYNIDMEKNLIAGVPDGIIQNSEVFQNYTEKVVGMADYRNYFNAGVILMNLDELRKYDFQNKFTYLLEMIKFPVAQDQDYLNRLCKGRVKIIDFGWNVMPTARIGNLEEKDIKIIHYNFAYKPWHFENVPLSEYFWKYAEQTEFLDEVKKIKEAYTEEQRFKDREAEKNLEILALKECSCVGDDRYLRKNNEVKEVENNKKTKK